MVTKETLEILLNSLREASIHSRIAQADLEGMARDCGTSDAMIQQQKGKVAFAAGALLAAANSYLQAENEALSHGLITSRQQDLS